MKKLKTKIFFTIFTILTISMISILVIYNSTNYIREKNSIKDNLSKMITEKRDGEHEPPEKKDDKEAHPDMPEGENPRFMDVFMYTVILEDDKINKIISHTKDETTPNEIQTLANTILKKKNKNSLVIGNLYLEKYSYRYQNNQIIIIDNSEVNEKLRIDLLVSIIVFFLFEGISFVVCNEISKWIIQPVEASFNKQKQFIADASHELKTPLSVIMASADAMESDHDGKWLHNIQSESNRMSDLIKELLDLAKLENEESSVSMEENNLSKLVEMSILPLESLIYEKNLTFHYDIEDHIKFTCNSSEMKQLITILMDNAIKHCKSKGKIHFSCKTDGSNILIEVGNEGDAIPKGEEEKIFERFYRVDQSRNRNENRYGLGLAIAKRIVVNHHGKIKAHSRDGVTTFSVTFKK